MAKKANLTIYAFKVMPGHPKAIPFIDLIKKVNQESDLSKRIRSVKASRARLDDIRSHSIPINGQQQNCVLLDFVRFRVTNGPGKADPKTQVSGFTFTPGQAFGEETAALFFPKTQHLLVQYNHHGIRYGGIQDYFNSIDDISENIYELRPVYEDDIESLYRQKKHLRGLSLSVDPRHLSSLDRAKGTSLSNALSLGMTSGAGKIDIDISVGSRERGKSLGQPIIDLADQALSLAQRKPMAVNNLKANIELDDKIKMLDLIQSRLSVKFRSVPVDQDLRINRKERYSRVLKSLVKMHPSLK